MIEAQNLSYTYNNSKVKAVNNINFSISKGEIFGFLGPSGAGKSTTQNILIRLLTGYEGTAKIYGKNLNSFGSELYETIGVGFELPNHFIKLSAYDNLKFFKSLYSGNTRGIDELLSMVNLQDYKKEKVESFSKGMKMRLNFIRALLNNPDIIFLDEPTTGLDPVNAKIVKDIILEERSKGKTIFVTTHDMYVADDLCDRVAFIVDGSIAEIDSPKELKLKYGERKVRIEYLIGNNVAAKEFDLDSFGSNDEFLNIIKNNRVRTIHSMETTLEQVFIKVTGRGLK